MSESYFNQVSSVRWTAEELRREKERRLAEDLTKLGPRPSWWRPRARRKHDRFVRYLEDEHAKDLRTMLTTRDPTKRAIMGHLIGWKAPSRQEAQ